jgi:hypothetical protein
VILLVAVKSCWRDYHAGFHDAIRETWAKDFPSNVIVRFFMGVRPERDGSILKKDEVEINSKDDYISLPFKTREICKWIGGKRIDHAYLCDNDTYVIPKKLLALPYELSDYAGYLCQGPSEIGTRFNYRDHQGSYERLAPWCSGGVGYFLSQKAAIAIANSYPTVWAEDMYAGQVMGDEYDDKNAVISALDINNTAAFHFRKSKLFPQWTPDLLRRAYREGGLDKIYAEARQ